MFTLTDLRSQPVRDLAYSCFSEPLICNFSSFAGADAPLHCSLPLNETRIDWLRQLDREPDLLLAHLRQVNPKRLGFYHEALWHFFLQQDTEVELVAKNLQVTQDGRTIGEFDIIYQDLRNGRHVHLELAYKFYLEAPERGQASLAHWLGPNVNDRLDLKLEHMLSHQCQLSRTEGGRQQLARLGIDQIATEISLRGCLLHADRDSHKARPTAPLNRRIEQGHWLPHSKFSDQLNLYTDWVVLPRLNWISPLSSAVTEQLLAPLQLKTVLDDHFAGNESPVMLCAVDTRQSAGLAEQVRFMVTPDHWPELESSR